MGWTDTAKDLALEIGKLFKDLVQVQARVDAIKEHVDRTREDQHDFIEQTRGDIRDLQKDFDEVRRRLSRIEGTLDSIAERSMKEALLQLAREYQAAHGSLERFGLRGHVGTPLSGGADPSVRPPPDETAKPHDS